MIPARTNIIIVINCPGASCGFSVPLLCLSLLSPPPPVLHTEQLVALTGPGARPAAQRDTGAASPSAEAGPGASLAGRLTRAPGWGMCLGRVLPLLMPQGPPNVTGQASGVGHRPALPTHLGTAEGSGGGRRVSPLLGNWRSSWEALTLRCPALPALQTCFSELQLAGREAPDPPAACCAMRPGSR